MHLRRAPSASLTLAAALSGAVAGHTLTYLLAVPQAGARDALLASTGHSYWSAAVAVALVLGLSSAIAVAVRHVRGGLRGSSTMSAYGVGRLAVRLAAMQVGIFLIQETLERYEAGAPLTGIHTERLLLVGILVQALVAGALALALFFLAAAAAAAGRALRSPLTLPASRPTALALPMLALRSRLVTAGGGSRAPPR
jgi:hypothetical protein